MKSFDLWSRYVDADSALEAAGLPEDGRIVLWRVWQERLLRVAREGGLEARPGQEPGVAGLGAAAWVRPGSLVLSGNGGLLEVGWPTANDYREPVMVPVRVKDGYSWATRQMIRSEPEWWAAAKPARGCVVDGQEDRRVVEALVAAMPAIWATEGGWRGLKWMGAAPGWVERVWPLAEPAVRSVLAQQRARWFAQVFALQGDTLVVMPAEDLERRGARLVEPSRRGFTELRRRLAERGRLRNDESAAFTWFGSHL